MAKTKKSMCQNCGFKTEEVCQRGERWLCFVCAKSMPGIYPIGGSGEHSLPAVVMRQISFCTNLVLSEIRRLNGDARNRTGFSLPTEAVTYSRGRAKRVRNVAGARKRNGRT